MESKNYYIGLDIGTDSVGYAVTDEYYKPIKFKGEPMMGVHLFDPAATAAERRTFRTSRRRLNRKQQRISLLNELFAKEIGKIDEQFFIRLKESGLHRDDISTSGGHIYFNNEIYSDKDYYKQYPTIHHLISELMKSDKEHDIRLVYIACAWLIGHRGHFLNEVDKDNISGVLDFSLIYSEFVDYITDNEFCKWEITDIKHFSEVLQKKANISTKEKEIIAECLPDGKKPKDAKISSIIKLLCGGKCELKALFDNSDYADLEIKSVFLGMPDEQFATVLAQIGDDGELLIKMKAIYDWSLLKVILGEHKCISDAKIAVYEQHKKDLHDLKYIIRKYAPEKYHDVFKKTDKKINNYVSYVYNVREFNVSSKENIPDKFGCTKDDFLAYIKSVIKNISGKEEDILLLADINNRISDGSFMPKQVETNNRVIPYQLYWYEINEILKKASSYLTFLNDKDENGISVKEKILSVFTFRVPYFVGPLKDYWAVRKEGRIYPWNFENMVDFEASEEAFINNLTNNCTYIPGESVLPKNSLLYTKYNVLNEINNIKINGVGISPDTKRRIYNEVFYNKKNKKVTPKKICDFLVSNNLCTKDDTLSGIDETIKSSLGVHLDFDRLITGGILTKEQVERIIEKITYTENSRRIDLWLKKDFPFLSDDDRKYICRLKYKDFGRLSRYLLEEVLVTRIETGEVNNIIGWMWDNNYNFMQLTSSEFNLTKQLEEINKEYYSSHPMSLDKKLEEMYVSNSVKRPIIRTMAIIDEIETAMGCAPSKIFIEMARGATADQKNKRTKTRKAQLIELYSKIKDEAVKEMNRQLDELGEMADNILQSESVYLYFLQLGRCAYTGRTIDNFNQLRDGTYNVDHIYPRAFVKDDSLDNKVLVHSDVNGSKSNIYPIDSKIREERYSYWLFLKNNGLISDEKFKRLTRATPFSVEERWNFINRQLVETRQSTKALATILSDRFSESTKIVYVKAGLVSELRHEVLHMEKTRSVNDLHHAKDAYLNIVAGNVYNTVFTKKWFMDYWQDGYSVKSEILFSRPHPQANWLGAESIDAVRKTVAKNAIHSSRYAYTKKGGLFDQMPVKARAGLIPRKTGLDTAKYGGYNKASTAYFVLVKFRNAKKQDIIFMPVKLLYAEKFKADVSFAEEYAKKQIQEITGKEISEVSFPLEVRPIKINTVISLDGLLFNIRSSDSGGTLLSVSLLTPNVFTNEWEQYIKRLDSFSEKLKKNASIKYDEKYDVISKEKNLELYDIIIKKLQTKPFCDVPANPVDYIIKGKEYFLELNISEQVNALMQIISILKTGRSSPCDLTKINGVPTAAKFRINALLSNLAKNSKDIRITDISASGLYEKKSVNLIELL